MESCLPGGGIRKAVDCRYSFELKIKSGSGYEDSQAMRGFYVSSEKLLNGKIYYYNTKHFIGHNGRTWVFDAPAKLEGYLASQPVYFPGTYDSGSNPHGITLDGVTFLGFDIIRAAKTTDTATYDTEIYLSLYVGPNLDVPTTPQTPDWESYMSTPTPNDKMFSHISLAITGKAFIGILVDPYKESLTLFGILKPAVRQILGLYMLEDNSKTYGYFVGIEYPKDPTNKFLFKLSGFIHPNTWVFNNQRTNGSPIFEWPSSPVYIPPKPITNKICTACWSGEDVKNSQWPAQKSYSANALVGVNPETPFILDTATHRCIMNCADGYTLVINLNSATAVFDQQCENVTCKAWDNIDGKPGDCTECWNKTDVDNYSTWKGNLAYDAQEIVGRDAINPFLLSHSYGGKNSIIEVKHNETATGKSWKCTCQDGQYWIVTGNEAHEALCTRGIPGPELTGDSTTSVVCPEEYHGSKMHV
jgi:hypothetical protein